MPNICFYNMHVKGDQDNVVEFLRNLSLEVTSIDTANRACDYRYDIHTANSNGKRFARIFDSEIEDCYATDGVIVACIWGECAWSVYSCMMSGPGTYYKDGENENLTTIVDESKRCSVDVEVYSTESGMGFAEHLLVTAEDGVTVDEERQLMTIWWDKDEYPTFDDLIAGEGIDAEAIGLTEDDFDDGYAEKGGWIEEGTNFSF